MESENEGSDVASHIKAYHTALFCWGSTINGELGLGGIEEDTILSPRYAGKNFAKEPQCICRIACGRSHTVAVLQDGTIYSCGNNEKGQLGHTMSWRKFEQITALKPHFITHAACGLSHTLALNEAGQVFAWGNNSHGQLGLGINDDCVYAPRLVKKLAAMHVVQIVCGANHSMALTNTGQLYVWGQNGYGQLGIGSKGGYENSPCLLLTLTSVPIMQIAAGGNHSVALTVGGALFTWGRNTFGQLGLNDQEDRTVPTLLKFLKSQRIRYIACGDEHTAALTSEGGVFTFGAGMYGQLGHGSRNNEILPRRILELMGSTVTQISCGRCHTLAFVPSRGRIYAFGLGGSGQLGTGSTTNRINPVPLMGPWVTHCKELMPAIQSGPLVPLRRRRSSSSDGNPEEAAALFDRPGCSQEDAAMATSPTSSPRKGRDRTTDSSPSDEAMDMTEPVIEELSTPSSQAPDDDLGEEPVVEDPDERKEKEKSEEKLSPQVEITEYKEEPNPKPTTPYVIHAVACGGDQSFVIATRFEDKILPVDHRVYHPSTQILTVQNEILEQAKSVAYTDCMPQDIMSYLESVFSSSACLNASYYPKNEEARSTISSPAVDMSAAYECFHFIEEANNPSVPELVSSCLEKGVFPHLPTSPPDIEAMRLYVILPLCHLFHKPSTHLSAIICPYAEAVIHLANEYSAFLDVWWSKLKVPHFRNLIQIYKATVKHIINNLPPTGESRTSSKHKQLWLSLEVLAKLNRISKKNDDIVPYTEFYIPDLNEKIDIAQDYTTWLELNRGQRLRSFQLEGKLFFCDYPFVFDAQAKTIILQRDSALQMQYAVDSVNRHNLVSLFIPIASLENPFLVLSVTRQNLVQDTLSQLAMQNTSDFKKPLKVIFRGEDAVDAGGVRKEFFMLLLREILNPQYGMFIEYPETRCIWFNNQMFDDDLPMFELIGILCGLAIYNFTIIDLPFPLVLYKKLLNEPAKVEDLKGLSPTLAKSLNDLLQYEDDDFEDVFLLTFEITVEMYGEMKSFELKPNGKEISVTKENRKEYVNLYADFILNKSVANAFKAFSDGFHKVCGSRVLEIFHAQELMALVVGNENYDWNELEKNAEYKNGYSKDHTAIKRFWKVFHSLSEDDKKKFLLFLTGSVRIPILGMKALKIIIQPMNVTDDYLPVAHTCFNVLDLPYYTTEEALREKLLQAIQHTQGFGLA